MIEFPNAAFLMFDSMAGVLQLHPMPARSPARQVQALVAPVLGPLRLRRPAMTSPPRQVEPGHSGSRGQLV